MARIDAGALEGAADVLGGAKAAVFGVEGAERKVLRTRNVAGLKAWPGLGLAAGEASGGAGIDEGYAEVYRPTVWDEIPDALKDPDGHWVASYYGVMAIATNTTLVPDAPTSFADLEDPRYAGQVTLNGDPREAGAAEVAGLVFARKKGG